MAEAKPKKRSGGRRATPQVEVRTLDDLKQVRALADLLRMRILEALCEERTTKQVAELLREKPTRLYHHVDALERAGLVRLTRTQPKRGTVEKYYRSVARAFEGRVSTARMSGASRKAIDDLLGTAFATTTSELSALLERGAGSKVTKQGLLAFLEVRGTRKEIDGLRRRLQTVVRSTGLGGKESPRAERYRLTIVFYPMDAS